MLERYLDSSDQPFRRDDWKMSSRNGFLLRGIFPGRCCEDCNKIVESFCDLYCQIKNLELKINWRIWSLTNVMSSANKVASRVEGFRNSLTVVDGDVEGRNSFENVWTARKMLINNCARKLRHTYPKLTITKCDENQPFLPPSSLELSVFVSNKFPQKLSNSTSSKDMKTNISRSAPISTSSFETTSNVNLEDGLENSEMETETTPVQNNSPVVNNVVNIHSSVASRRKKISPQKENKNDKPNFSCNKCLKIFSTRIQLKFHQQSHLKLPKRRGEIKNLENHVMDEDEVSPSHRSDDTTVITGASVILPDQDTIPNKIHSISNSINSISDSSSHAKQLFLEKPPSELEADGDDAHRVDLDINSSEPINNDSSDDNVEQFQHETKTTPVQTISPAVKNLIKITTSMESSEKKKSPESKYKTKNSKLTMSCSKCPRVFSSRVQLKFHQSSHLKLDKRRQEFGIGEHHFDTEPIIILRSDDNIQNVNSNVTNSTYYSSSQERKILYENRELEANGDDEPRVDFELSDCKFDNFNSPATPALSSDDIGNPTTWETTPEQTIESTPVVLDVVGDDDTKQECPTPSLTSPMSTVLDTLHPTNEELERVEPPLQMTNCTSQSPEINSWEKISYTRHPSEDSTVRVSNRLRTVYKCNHCCKTYSNRDAQLLHEKSHLNLEDEGDEEMSSDGHKSEDDFDPGYEKDSDSFSSINDHPDEAEDDLDPAGYEKESDSSISTNDHQNGAEDWKSKDVQVKYECSTSPNANADVDNSPNGNIAREESSACKMKVSETNGPVENKPVSIENSLVKKSTSTKKPKRIPAPAVFIPPPKATTKIGSSTYKCECRKSFNSIGAYLHHRRKEHKSAHFPQNEEENSERVLPKTIMELELLMPKYSCSETECSKVFVMEEELEIHKKQHGTFQCQGCPVVKYFAPNLSIHEAKHKNTTGEATGKNLWNCFRCNFSCKAMSSYICHHMKKHLQVPTTIFMCPICRKSFHDFSARVRRKRTLNVHFKQFHDVSGMKPESVPKCSECSAYFRTEIQLECHKNSLCKQRCSDCGKVCSSKPYLIKHRLKYHVKLDTPLPFKCEKEDCGKAFEAKVDLELHIIKNHPSGKSSLVKCTICGKEVFQVNMTNHVYHAHKKPKPEKTPKICEKCGKSFQLNQHLQAHLLSHAGPQNWKFSCSICGRKCSSKGKLQGHERTHKKEKPFVCQVCGVSYAHRHNLRIHMNNKHSDVIQDIPKPRDKVNVTSRKGMKCKAVFDKVSDTIEDDFSD